MLLVVAALMKEFPKLASEALTIHNQLIRKAKWTNFGFTIDQEGGKLIESEYASSYRDIQISTSGLSKH